MTRGVLLFILLSSIIWARGVDFNIEREYHKYIDSLDKAPLEVREYFQSKYNNDGPFVRDSLNVRCVGRWPFGPSWIVEPSDHIDTDSLLFLGSGSGIRILKLSNPQSPQMISKIDAIGEITDGSGIKKKDSLLYVLSYANGLEIYSISNPCQPRRIGSLPIRSYRWGIAIKDSFAYIVGYDSLVRVINCANPSNLFQVDSLRLPDWCRAIDIKGNYAYVAAQLSGLRIIDISNPNHIQEISSIGGWRGYDVLVDSNYAYVSTGAGGLRIINIANPLIPQEVGSITSTPAARIYKKSFFVYAVSSDGNSSIFFIIDVSNPSYPTLIESTSTSGWGYDVCVLSPYSYGYTADHWEGMHIIDISNPTNPYVDTVLYGAESAEDIVVDNGRAYIADYMAGLKILDVSSAHLPSELGTYDTIGQTPTMETVVAKDSFAFVSWPLSHRWMRSVDVSDPANPRIAGLPDSCHRPRDMIIRDTFLYIAEDGKVEIFNVARPRQPRLVGSCNLPDDAYGMYLQDTFAYVANQYAGLKIINVANPNAPYVAGTFSMPGWTNGVFVKDTIAYVASLDIGLRIVNVKNPLLPYEVSSFPTGQTYDVVVRDSYAYVGCTSFKIINVSNPTNPLEIGHYSTSDYVRRVYVDSNFIYCACFGAGMCIFENLLAGIEETENRVFLPMFSILPNPVFDKVIIRLNIQQGGEYEVIIYNALGKLVSKGSVLNKWSKEITLNLSNISDGVYFISVRNEIQNHISKIIKINRGR